MVREDISEKAGFELRIDTEGGGRETCGGWAGGLQAGEHGVPRPVVEQA